MIGILGLNKKRGREMKSRLHMRSRDSLYMIEDEVSVRGMLRMKRIRREDKRFKCQRIITVIQAFPSTVPLNEIMKTT
jgi:hypothetical protein